jgi:type I restriction enzyme S subunit
LADASFLRFSRSPAWWDQVAKFINVGAIFESLKCADIPRFEIPIPPLPEQRAIASILGALDDKIELNRRMNETLEELARTLFKSWFVDFDPVKAKAEGRQPAGMDAETASLFPSRFVESELGRIPEGWFCSSVAELAAINQTSRATSDEFQEIKYVDISAVSRGDISGLATFRRGEEPSRARRRVADGDTVISTVRPERAAYFLVHQPPPNMVVSTGFAVLSPTVAPWAFLHSMVTQPDVFIELGRLADGGAYPAIRADVIARLTAIWPGSVLAERYQASAASLYRRASTNRLESRTLAQLRDLLLPKLMSGELRVPDAEKLAEGGGS